jgi:cytochrome c
MVDIITSVQNYQVSENGGGGGVPGVRLREGHLNIPKFGAEHVETNQSIGTKVGNHVFAVGCGRAAGWVKRGMSAFDRFCIYPTLPANSTKAAVDTKDEQRIRGFLIRSQEEAVANNAGGTMSCV